MNQFLSDDNMTDLLGELNRVKQPTILIVDDDPVIRRVMVNVFKSEPYNVETAKNAKEAWSVLKQQAPDLVLLDVEMPDVNGYELCKAIRQAPGLSDIPVIFLTGNRVEKQDVAVGLDLGADDYMCKPFEKEELLARVRAAMRKTTRS